MKTIIEVINNKQIIRPNDVLRIEKIYSKKHDLGAYLKKITYGIESSGYTINDKTILINEERTIELANQLFN